jgi:hypothetical protein
MTNKNVLDALDAAGKAAFKEWEKALAASQIAYERYSALCDAWRIAFDAMVSDKP